MKILRRYTPTLLILASLLAAQAQSQVPDGWYLAGNKASEYKVESDFTVVHGGHASAMLQSKQITVPGFGTLAQTIRPDQYLGKRVRFSGFIKTRGVNGWAGLWMRIDDRNQSVKPLAFDNMKNRSILGTTDWQQYDIVLDVPDRADEILFGVILSGGGTLWLDDVSLEEVDASVPVTDMTQPKAPAPTRPRNMDFER